MQLALLFVASTLLAGCNIMHSNKSALEGFAKLEFGMSYEEVKQIVGEPDTDVGSGVYIFRYETTDNYQVFLQFVTLKKLSNAWIVNASGERVYLELNTR